MIHILLLPFSILYDLATRFRNHLYNTGNRRSISFETNIISVGNLSVGGTGKTPMIEYLIRLLKTDYPLAVLSRGYGRKIKGFQLANDTSNATSIGDEPFQYYLKYGKEVTIAVGEERVLAIPTILYEKPETKIILLDDAYQHRSVKPLVNIMLTSYQKPFFKDHLLPSGRLREARKGASRADIIIITKCPTSITSQEQLEYCKQVYKYANPNTPVFFTSIRYGTPIPLYPTNATTANKKIILLTGLANADLFEQYVRSTYTLSEHIQHSDHYYYKESDIKHIAKRFNMVNTHNDHIIITTEKDYTKLTNPAFRQLLHTLPIFYIPIEVYFLKDKVVFDALIIKNGVQF